MEAIVPHPLKQSAIDESKQVARFVTPPSYFPTRHSYIRRSFRGGRGGGLRRCGSSHDAGGERRGRGGQRRITGRRGDETGTQLVFGGEMRDETGTQLVFPVQGGETGTGE